MKLVDLVIDSARLDARVGAIEIGGSYFAKWRLIKGEWFVEGETYVPDHCTGGAFCRTVP